MDSMVRVLLVAPDQPGLDSIPEIRQISKRTRATILNGPVSRLDVFEYATRGFDIIHFASHGDEEGVVLSDGVLSISDISSVARLARATLVFFNSCNSGKPASFSVYHGVSWAIYSNVDIAEPDAWKYVFALYDGLRGMEPHHVVDALTIAGSGEGDYGFTVSLALLDRMGKAMKELSNSSRRSILSTWQMGIVALSAIMTFVVAVYLAVNQLLR